MIRGNLLDPRLANGDMLDKEISRLKENIKNNSEDYDSIYSLGLIYYKLKEYDKSFNLLNSLSLDYNCDIAFILATFYYYNLNDIRDIDKAKALLEKSNLAISRLMLQKINDSEAWSNLSIEEYRILTNTISIDLNNEAYLVILDIAIYTRKRELLDLLIEIENDEIKLAEIKSLYIAKANDSLAINNRGDLLSKLRRIYPGWLSNYKSYLSYQEYNILSLYIEAYKNKDNRLVFNEYFNRLLAINDPFKDYILSNIPLFIYGYLNNTNFDLVILNMPNTNNLKEALNDLEQSYDLLAHERLYGLDLISLSRIALLKIEVESIDSIELSARIIERLAYINDFELIEILAHKVIPLGIKFYLEERIEWFRLIKLVEDIYKAYIFLGRAIEGDITILSHVTKSELDPKLKSYLRRIIN